MTKMTDPKRENLIMLSSLVLTGLVIWLMVWDGEAFKDVVILPGIFVWIFFYVLQLRIYRHR